jgi:hypothetical protein
VILLKNHRFFIYFAELSARLRVNEPNLRFVHLAQKMASNFVQYSILQFSQKYGIIYLSRGQGNGHHTKASMENGNEKFLKIFKKTLDKQYQVWYNKYVS